MDIGSPGNNGTDSSASQDIGFIIKEEQHSNVIEQCGAESVTQGVNCYTGDDVYIDTIVKEELDINEVAGNQDCTMDIGSPENNGTDSCVSQDIGFKVKEEPHSDVMEQCGAESVTQDVKYYTGVFTRDVFIDTIVKEELDISEVSDVYLQVKVEVPDNDEDYEKCQTLTTKQKPTKKGASAAVRNRLYRERHRDEINQRRNDIRRRKKNSQQNQTLSDILKNNDIEQITEVTSSNQHYVKSFPASAAERSRLYRERHREEINQRRIMQRKKNSQQIQTLSDIQIINEIDQITNVEFINQLRHAPSISTSAAERSRLYRERHREELNQRRREIRQNKKNSQQIQTLSEIFEFNDIEQITDVPSTSLLQQALSIPASAAERNRLYRERNRQIINKRRRESRMLQQKHSRTHIGEKPFQCDICMKTFANEAVLVLHSRSHTVEKPFQCEFCDKGFKTRGQVLVHSATHTGEKPFKCDICKKTFGRQGNLVRHRRTHTGEKPFHCEICSKAFVESGPLVRHSRTHTGEKPFQCDVCNKAFKTRTELVGHSRTHTGEKPFECDVCKKTFKRRGDILVHCRTHTIERPFQCDVCKKAFVESGQLVKHRRTHTVEKPFKCDICNKECIRRIDLVIHSRTHSGEKPFECDICKKAFKSRGELVIHSRTHTGEKPYQCDICKKPFRTRGHLVVHRGTHI